MFKKRNLIFLCLLILGVLLIAGYLFSKAPVTVTFDSQGGSAVDSQKVDHGGKPTKPTAPTRTGHTFDAWFKESGCTNAWDFDSDKVTSDVTLFAKWTPDYAIRDTGPAGGLIFYDKGSYSGGWRYLEAAPSDQHYMGDYTVEWGCHGTLITGADGIAVGTGEQNTIDIENGCATAGTAADICANLSLGGYSDWFLPSKDELNLMYTNLKVAGVGGFESDGYWSSSEDNAHSAWGQRFGVNVYQPFVGKLSTGRVRAVRAF
ncbi:MAG: InlB B-repeat-containing protein [Proteobacteria bacterium]|nr:InlB B-repeat-containing protein [Pseudomonadota bacterium]